ncbi:MAG: TetR/AcrR family transcriptional regulator [Anaerovoracaceae bacterium]
MKSKKHHIVEIATSCFIENGYSHSSMQDIAKNCNISKATIYKYFSSKEDLGLNVVYYLTEELAGNLSLIRQREDLSPMEKLRESIISRMKYFNQQNSFIEILLLSLTPVEKERYLSSLYASKFHIFNIFAEIVAETFNPEGESNVYEITLCLNGLLKEISVINKEQTLKIPPTVIANFILDSLSGISKARQGKPPLLTPGQINTMKAYREAVQTKYQPFFNRNHELKYMREIINTFSDKSEQEAYLEAIDLLNEEYRQSSPRSIVIRAFWAFLEGNEALKPHVINLKELNKLSTQSNDNE